MQSDAFPFPLSNGSMQTSESGNDPIRNSEIDPTVWVDDHDVSWDDVLPVFDGEHGTMSSHISNFKRNSRT